MFGNLFKKKTNPEDAVAWRRGIESVTDEARDDPGVEKVFSWTHNGMPATVSHVHPIGPVVRIELQHDAEIVEVELSRERHEALQLVVGPRGLLLDKKGRALGVERL